MRVAGLTLAALFLLLAGGWTAAWFYAAGAAGRALEGWMDGELAQGRRWTCPGRRVGGYPTAIEVTCDHPTFAGLALGEQASGSVARARLRLSALDPRRAVLVFEAPLAYRSDDGTSDFTADWSALALDVSGLPDAVAGGTLSGAGVAARGRFGGTNADIPRLGRLDLAVASVAAVDPTLDFHLALEGVPAVALDRALGDAQPVSSVFAGRLTQAMFADAETLPALIERWRQRGGSISLSVARAARGAARMEATGALHLDGNHRVEGKLDASFTGAGPILRRYGINPNLVAAGSILNSLFGKRDAATRPPGDPDAIRLPLQFRNGHLGVGPVVTAVELPPLY